MADGLGVGLETIARVLQAALDGRRVTLLSTGDEERHVVLSLPQPRPEELAKLRFTSATPARTSPSARSPASSPPRAPARSSAATSAASPR